MTSRRNFLSWVSPFSPTASWTSSSLLPLLLLAVSLRAAEPPTSAAPVLPLTLAFEQPHWLVIRGPELPGKEIRINYLEAYCRAGSTDADWVKHTVIPHKAEVLSLSDDRRTLRLRDILTDGVIVEHTVTTKADEVDFRLVARNPGSQRSEAHWAQPCVRLGDFTGFDPRGRDLDDYLPKCFIFLNGKLVRLPDVRHRSDCLLQIVTQISRVVPRRGAVSSFRPAPRGIATGGNPPDPRKDLRHGQ